MAEPPRRRALFLDRDGVINEDTGFLHEIAACRFVDGIFELVGRFTAAGFVPVIVTNQSGIGRGYYTEAAFQSFMAWMRAEFARRGAPIAAVYHCPDHPTEGRGPYRRESPRRKPGPGMFQEAARELGLDLARSWSIGDKPSDLEAGRAAGVGTLVHYDPLVSRVQRCEDYWVVPRLADVGALLAGEG